jgi:hypothetical protein
MGRLMDGPIACHYPISLMPETSVQVVTKCRLGLLGGLELDFGMFCLPYLVTLPDFAAIAT